MSRLVFWAVAPLLFLLQACGGSGSGSDSQTTTAATAPTAVAPLNFAVETGTDIILDASASSDPNGEQLSFFWEIKTRSGLINVPISDPTAPTLIFNPVTDGSWLVTVTVTNESGESQTIGGTVGCYTPSGPTRQVLLFNTADEMFGWLIDEPISLAEEHIRNGYPELLDGWLAGDIIASELSVPEIFIYRPELYEVVNWVPQLRMAP